MTTDAAAAPPEEPSRDDTERPGERLPLGLPGGSVRALLTIIVVLFAIVRVIQGEEVGLLWNETLMIALAHYFTSRRFVELSPRLVKELTAEGQIESESHPLYLPRHTIRAFIVLAFVALGGYLLQAGRLFEQQSVAILGTVGAYFFGMLFKFVTHWWSRQRSRQPSRKWVDAKALVTLGVLLLTVLLQLTGLDAWMPFHIDRLESLTLMLILFYFGSR